MAMRPKIFRYNGKGGTTNTALHVGLIAQDVPASMAVRRPALGCASAGGRRGDRDHDARSLSFPFPASTRCRSTSSGSRRWRRRWWGLSKSARPTDRRGRLGLEERGGVAAAARSRCSASMKAWAAPAGQLVLQLASSPCPSRPSSCCRWSWGAPDGGACAALALAKATAGRGSARGGRVRRGRGGEGVWYRAKGALGRRRLSVGGPCCQDGSQT